MLTNFTQKNSKYFECKECDFKCCNKNDYNRHILTRKHKMLTNVDSVRGEKGETIPFCLADGICAVTTRSFDFC